MDLGSREGPVRSKYLHVEASNELSSKQFPSILHSKPYNSHLYDPLYGV